jgi:hypothetical protein
VSQEGAEGQQSEVGGKQRYGGRQLQASCASVLLRCLTARY